MIRGQLDAAPFIMVFFLVLIFVLLGTLTYTPGIQVSLPVADDLPGIDGPTLSVAVDPQNRLYFENQLLSEPEFSRFLRTAAAQAESLTLIIHADRDVSHETLVRVTQLARAAGIHRALLATMPRLFPSDTRSPAAAP